MLIISRKKNQKIVVADEIEITILDVGRNRVRFGIKAPKHIPIQTRLKSSPDSPDSGPPSVESTPGPKVTGQPMDNQAMPAAVGYFKRS
jgi:hypothetical protein